MWYVNTVIDIYNCEMLLPSFGHVCLSCFKYPVIILQLYRHGDRTPVTTYPTDPYNNASYWPDGWGQLTNVRF